MSAIHETAYPRIRLNMTEKELFKIYTPNKEEIEFAKKNTYVALTRLGLLVLLKVFQRLGYFPQIDEIPTRIINHIAVHASLKGISRKIRKYDSGGSRWKHMALIRSRLGIKAYSEGGEKTMINVMIEASQSKNIIADIINASIEELIRQKFELPSFSTMNRAAHEARHEVNNVFYKQINNDLTKKQKSLIASLLDKPEEGRSLWHRLKHEPRQPTTKNMREFAKHMHWLRSLNKKNARFDFIPEIKVKHFADEAKTLDLTGIDETRENKKYAFMAALIFTQAAKATDDFTDIFVRRLQSVHNRGREALNEYRILHQDKTDKLVHTLEEIVSIWKTDNTDAERIEAVDSVISDDADNLLKQCRAHMIFSENNYLPFLPKLYKSQRKNYFEFVEIIKPKSSSTDKSLENAIKFIISKRNMKADKIEIVKKVKNNDGTIDELPLVNLSWVPDKWWKTVTGISQRKKTIQNVNRIYFEICLFSIVMQALKSGDLYIESSDKYGDYSKQFVSWKEFKKEITHFLKQIGLPTDINQIAPGLKNSLLTSVLSTDKSFPSNESVSIKNEELVIRKIPKTRDPEGLDLIKQLLTERMPELNLIDILSDTEHWINWTSDFRPISGYEARIDSPQEKYIKTTFCYGCYLGPTQTERSLDGISRKQIAYLNQRHIDEDKLQQSIIKTIDQYNKFKLPKVWGHGKSASADGTKWDMYQRNLLSEYHIRYGGWGGIGYYHVSDSYIALFSHFIPCGVYEAIYILDGLLKNKSE
ncbi:MAG: Tn3 family transposase, partial [Desulfobacterales bacterium]|nr:Tn3 family transposase [Desulfobacterales bacterium]